MKLVVERRVQNDPEAAAAYWIGLDVRGTVADALANVHLYRFRMMAVVND